MRAFPKLSDLYATWKRVAEETGNVRIVTQRVVTRVKRSSGKTGSVKVWTRSTQGTNKDQDVIGAGEEEIGEEFDELILAVDADAALKILGDDASWMEAKVLGNVKVNPFLISSVILLPIKRLQYLWDVTVTHNDFEYMNKVCTHFLEALSTSESHPSTIVSNSIPRSNLQMLPKTLRTNTTSQKRTSSHCTISEVIPQINSKSR